MALLQYVAEHDGATVHEAAEALRIMFNNVSALVTRLTEAGLLERRQDDTDKRVAHLCVTAKARQRIGEVQNIAAAQLASALRTLTDGDLDALGSALGALAALARHLAATTRLIGPTPRTPTALAAAAAGAGCAARIHISPSYTCPRAPAARGTSRGGAEQGTASLPGLGRGDRARARRVRCTLEGLRVFGEQAADDGITLRALVVHHLARARVAWPVGTAGADCVLATVQTAVEALCEGYERAQQLAFRQEESRRREFIDDLLYGRGDLGRLVERAEQFGLRLSMPTPSPSRKAPIPTWRARPCPASWSGP
ncbi:hypothetical protein SVIOM74S_00521 [Streptomyces violarus]